MSSHANIDGEEVMQRYRANAAVANFRPSMAGKIILPKRAAVVRFLHNESPLAELLPTICRQVRNRFGPAVELSLELYTDPEIDEAYLTLYVRQSDYDMTIMDRIDAVRDELATLLDRVAGRLLITTDFCPPRRSPGNAVKRVRGRHL
jgi:hypothetical protein